MKMSPRMERLLEAARRRNAKRLNPPPPPPTTRYLVLSKAEAATLALIGEVQIKRGIQPQHCRLPAGLCPLGRKWQRVLIKEPVRIFGRTTLYAEDPRWKEATKARGWSWISGREMPPEAARFEAIIFSVERPRDEWRWQLFLRRAEQKPRRAP